MALRYFNIIYFVLNLDFMKINECLVANKLLTNIIKVNKHLNVTYNICLCPNMDRSIHTHTCIHKHTTKYVTYYV